MRDRTARWGAAVVLLASLGGGRATAQGTLTSDDGLSISMSESGAIQSLRLAGQEYASTTLPSGFAFRELGATADVVKNGSLEAGGGVPSECAGPTTPTGAGAGDRVDRGLGLALPARGRPGLDVPTQPHPDLHGFSAPPEHPLHDVVPDSYGSVVSSS
jgi:hypothetical protein